MGTTPSVRRADTRTPFDLARPRSVPDPLVATTAVAFYLSLHLRVLFLAPVEPFDEGLRLATATLVRFGQVPYRDFYIPYGPMGGWLGAGIAAIGGGLVAQRFLFVGGTGVAIALIVHIVHRRQGLGAALITTGLLVRYPPSPPYVFPYLALASAMLLFVGKDADGEGFRGPDLRVLAVGLVLATASWFRFELAVWLLPWTVLTLRAHGAKPWLALPWVTGAVPYLLLAAMGGLHGLRTTLHYAASGYPIERSMPVPWGAAHDFVMSLGDLSSPVARSALETSFVLTLAYVGSAVTLIAWMSGWIGRWAAEREAARTSVQPIGERVSVLDRIGVLPFLWWILAFSFLSLTVRADEGHAINLITPLLLFWGWQPPLLAPRRGAEAQVVRAWPGSGLVVLILLAISLAQLSGQVVWLLDVSSSTAKAASVGPLPGRSLGDMGDDLRAIKGYSDLRRGAPLLVVNRRNDVAFINAPFIFYGLDRPTAGWPVVYDPGLADDKDVHAGVVDVQCKGFTDVVAWDAPVGPLYRAEQRRSPLLDRFIALNYRLEFSGEQFDYRVPDRSTCLRPRGVDPDVLGEIRRARASQGDLMAYAILGEAQAEIDQSLSPYERGDRALASILAGIPHALPTGQPHRLIATRLLAAEHDVGRAGGPYALPQHELRGQSGDVHLANAVLAAVDSRTGDDLARVTAELRRAVAESSELSGLVCAALTRTTSASRSVTTLLCGGADREWGHAT